MQSTIYIHVYNHFAYTIGFEKSQLPRTIINIINTNYLKYSNSERKQMPIDVHTIYHNSVAIHMDQLLNGWLAELPTIFRLFFTSIVNTKSTSVGLEVGGWQGAT